VAPLLGSLLLLLAAGAIAGAPGDAAPTAPSRDAERQQIRAALSVPEALPALAAEHYGQVEFAPGVIAERVSYATDYGLRVPGGGNLDGEGGYWDSSSKKMCQAIPYQAMKFLGDRGAALYDLHAATLVWNGSADDVVSISRMGANFFEDLRHRAAVLHGSHAFEFGFTPGGGHRPYFVTRPVALWLEKRLDFPDWTAEAIAKMPETHISEWARKNGVFLDKLYATELREGGTRALGTGVPAVAHDLLDTLPEEVWQREKEKYAYETWVKAARARVKSE
jgi:hypothetical protein